MVRRCRCSQEGKVLKELEPANIEAIKGLVQKGQRKGFLTYSEIADALSQLDLTSQQIDDIYKHFEDLGIDVLNVKKGQDVSVKADGDGDDEASETLEAASLEADADEDMPEGAQVDEP